MKKKIKIIYNRNNCIGALACIVAAPLFWEKAEDGKADLVHGIKNPETGKIECILEVNEEEYDRLKKSEITCPVRVIEIIDL
jgi:ferredoxin